MMKQLQVSIAEQDYGYLDNYICYSVEGNNYWLFIVPKEYEDGRLWEYCKHNSIAAMQYLDGVQGKREVTVNIGEIKKIRKNDKVVVYLNDKIVGCVGEVNREFYEDTSN